MMANMTPAEQSQAQGEKARRRIKIIVWVAVVDAVILAAIAAFTYITVFQPLPQNGAADKFLLVDTGSSLSQVVRQLEREGRLVNGGWLIIYARLTGQTDIKRGQYLIDEGMSAQALINKLIRGDVVRHEFTLIEGKTFREAFNQMALAEYLVSELSDQDDASIKLQLNIDYPHLEGLFFPDTYHYTAGMTDKEILLQAYQRLTSILQEEWQKRAENLPYKNAYEALIMASIVEKETGLASERPAIAGVFVRRLKMGMKLQTDPTVIYGMGESYKGNIQRKHLQQDTAYNTYTRYGLPPTPIALAGREAIHAALHPADGDALYFVGKGDGSHYFSATLEEHNQAVQKYQIRRKKDYHSAPKASPSN